MKTRIAIGAGLLLTLGSAVAGALIYGQVTTPNDREFSSVLPVASQATPETIAMWKAIAVAVEVEEYVAPKVPI